MVVKIPSIRLYVSAEVEEGLATCWPDQHYAVCRGLDRPVGRALWEVVGFTGDPVPWLAGLDPKVGRAVVNIREPRVVLIGQDGLPLNETATDRAIAAFRRAAFAAVDKMRQMVDIFGEPTSCYGAGPHFWLQQAETDRGAVKWLATHRVSLRSVNPLERPLPRPQAAVLAFALQQLPGIDWGLAKPLVSGSPYAARTAHLMTLARSVAAIYELFAEHSVSQEIEPHA
jgi:hypothetical protein